MVDRSELQQNFEAEINKLFQKRIYSILKLADIKKPGKDPTFSAQTLETTKGIISDLFVKINIQELENKEIELYKKCIHYDIIPNIKWDLKEKHFKKWFDQTIGKKKLLYFVYILKKDDLIVYIGRTQNGKGRPSSHFAKRWFNKIDILPSSKQNIVNDECLMIHLHQPKYNKIKSGNIKYASECKICTKIKEINKNLDWIFNKK